MPHRAHVGLVDAHPERVRGHDHVGLAGHELVLGAAALVGREPGVVDGRVQQRAGLLGALAGAAVDDRGAVLVELHAGQQGRPLARHRALAVERQHVEREVRAVEAGADALGVAQAEPHDDLLGDLRRRGRRAGHRGRVAELGDDRREPQIVGAEVVTPLRDAVRLVDDEQVQLALRERGPERGGREPLGCGERDRRRAVPNGLDRRLVVLARGEHDGGVAERGEPVALVAHQGDQGRHDDGQVGARERGELVAEALAAAGGHDDERVAAVERGLYRLALARPEAGEAEQREQRLRRARGCVPSRRQLRDRRQRVALVGGELAPHRAQFVERGVRAVKGVGEEGECAVHVRAVKAALRTSSGGCVASITTNRSGSAAVSSSYV